MLRVKKPGPRSVYVSAPFTGTVEDQERRIEIVSDYCIKLISRKVCAVSPVLHCINLAARAKWPTTHEPWIAFNEGLIRSLDEVHVLCIPGWTSSRGVWHEVDFACRVGTPVYLLKEMGENEWSAKRYQDGRRATQKLAALLAGKEEES